MNDGSIPPARARTIILALAAATITTGCFREVVRTFDIHVPQMRTDAAADRVRTVIRVFDTNTLHGVEVDLPSRTVTVTYHSERVARRNFERALAAAGFDANDLKADPAARAILPEDMR